MLEVLGVGSCPLQGTLRDPDTVLATDSLRFFGLRSWLLQGGGYDGICSAMGTCSPSSRPLRRTGFGIERSE